MQRIHKISYHLFNLIRIVDLSSFQIKARCTPYENKERRRECITLLFANLTLLYTPRLNKCYEFHDFIIY